MNKTPFSIVQLEMFTATVEAGSFAKAADVLEVTSVAVSKQITTLEKTLGMALLIRSTRSLQLTKAGETFYFKCQQILAQMQQMQDLAQSLQHKPAGKIQVIISASMYKHIFLPLLQKFYLQYPEIELDILIQSKIPSMQTCGADIIFGAATTWLPPENYHLVSIPLFKICRTLIGSKSYFKKHGRPDTLESMKNFCYIHDLRFNADSFIKLCSEKKILLKQTLRVNNIEALTQSVLAGLGIGLLPNYTITSPQAQNQLQSLANIFHEPHFPVYIFHEKMTYIPEKIKVFKNFFQSHCKQLSFIP